MAVSLREIAEEAGVSVSTVCRVLNGKSEQYRISEVTAKKVLRISREKGYVPNVLAQRLVKKESRVVGVLVPSYGSLASYVNSRIFQGIGDVVSKNGYHLEIISAECLENVDQEIEAVFKGKRVDGLLLWYGNSSRFIDQLVDQFSFPYCYVQYLPENPRRHSVVSCNIEGAGEAVKYLLRKGHERIGIVVSLTSREGRLRLEGYKQTMADAGLPWNDDYLVQVTYAANIDNIQINLDQLERAISACSALFITSDLVAIRIIDILRDKGIKVPEDISIVGFDGIDMVKYSSPRLSTIKQKGYTIGTTAAEILIDQIKGRSVEPAIHYIETELIERDSVIYLE